MYCRNLALSNTPKSTIDVAHRLTVARFYGDLGKIGGLLKLWLSTDSKSAEAKDFNVRQVMNDLSHLKEQTKRYFEKIT